MNIDLLTTAFGTASVLVLAGAAYRFRRVPIVRMIRASEQRIGAHRDALAGLALVMQDARERRDRVLFERLSENYRFHRAALLALDSKATARSVPAAPAYLEVRKAA